MDYTRTDSRPTLASMQFSSRDRELIREAKLTIPRALVSYTYIQISQLRKRDYKQLVINREIKSGKRCSILISPRMVQVDWQEWITLGLNVSDDAEPSQL